MHSLVAKGKQETASLSPSSGRSIDNGLMVDRAIAYLILLA